MCHNFWSGTIFRNYGLFPPNLGNGLNHLSSVDVFQGTFNLIQRLVDIRERVGSRNAVVPRNQLAVAMEVHTPPGAGSNESICHLAIVFKSILESTHRLGEPEEETEACSQPLNARRNPSLFKEVRETGVKCLRDSIDVVIEAGPRDLSPAPRPATP